MKRVGPWKSTMPGTVIPGHPRGPDFVAFGSTNPATLPTPEQITPVFVYLAANESRHVTGQSLEAHDFLSR